MVVELRLPAADRPSIVEGSTVRFTPGQVRALLVTLAFVSSVLVGVVAGVLAHQDDKRVAGSILFGGGAFISWMTLSLLVMGALGWLSLGENASPIPDTGRSSRQGST
ncbi:hypothetical protein AB0C70_26680 [Streptomyces sp. NPDC048564]|uniref:hypothetical protein n=1 Tax=Streptomyces sp. NPDC048564 TaxID=3155760 RepID=UPI00344A1621